MKNDLTELLNSMNWLLFNLHYQVLELGRNMSLLHMLVWGIMYESTDDAFMRGVFVLLWVYHLIMFIVYMYNQNAQKKNIIRLKQSIEGKEESI